MTATAATDTASTVDDGTFGLVGGLVNMHDHLRSFLVPGRHADAAPLADVVTMAAATQAAATPEDYLALTTLAAARQVLAGTTTAVDHVYPLHRPGLLDAVLAGHRAVGLRGVIALGILTRGREDLCTSVDDVVDLARTAAGDGLASGRLYLAPVSLRQNAIEDYARVAEAAEELGIGLYTHIAENTAEVEDCRARYGRRPVELLADQGFLGERTVLVHAICLSDTEIRLLAESGTSVVYCPTNHARLAKPVARVVDLIDAGVRVTLGVDGAESVPHEMRQAIAAQGQAAGRPGALGTADALAMGTTAAVAALVANGLAPDFAAQDEVRFDFRSAAVGPVTDPEWALVHRVTPREVQHVTVAGRAVVRDGLLVAADVHHLVRAAHEATIRLAERAGRSAHRLPDGSGS